MSMEAPRDMEFDMSSEGWLRMFRVARHTRAVHGEMNQPESIFDIGAPSPFPTPLQMLGIFTEVLGRVAEDEDNGVITEAEAVMLRIHREVSSIDVEEAPYGR